MDCTIQDKPAFNAAIVKHRFTTLGGAHLKEIPQWWTDFLASPDGQAMKAINGSIHGPVTRGAMLSVSLTDTPVEDVNNCEFIYCIGVELGGGKDAGKFEEIAIPSATWAIFGCTLSNLQDIAMSIYTDWFPSSGYVHAETPEIEVYLQNPSGEKPPCQIWIPVIKKL